jgi:hypothetical protein
MDPWGYNRILIRGRRLDAAHGVVRQRLTARPWKCANVVLVIFSATNRSSLQDRDQT